jgi:hypothetical protein
MEEKIRVTGNLTEAGTFSVNAPLSLVKVPVLVPLMLTDTAPTLSLVPAFFTVPDITWAWAKTKAGNRNNSRAAQLAIFFISKFILSTNSGQIKDCSIYGEIFLSRST